MTRSMVRVADFETTTDPDDCRVWAYSICDIPTLSVTYGTSLYDFFREIWNQNSIVYFHNLAFDGSFILDSLLNHHYVHTTEQFVRKGEFTTLISKDGKFYSITVRWPNGKQTEFRDSFKKLPMGVSRIAKAFQLEESKLKIDYDAPRPIGHTLTDEEIDYITNDVVIVAKALMQQFDSGMTRLTVGSDSLHMYKKLNPSFDKEFPVLPYDMDADIRLAYRGGFTYADTRFKGKVVGNGKVYDVNSLYPSVMYNCLLPYGFPVWCDGAPEISDEYPLYIASITFTAKLKPNHIPCIQLKASSFYLPTDYVSDISEPTTMSLTNVDFDLWSEQYDMEVLSWNGAWLFHGEKGFFRDYIDYWMDIKQKSTGGLREIAKLHLNALYGKFATNPDVTRKIPELENHILRLHTGDAELRNPVYTPMGVFITAYARDKTIRAAQDHYDIFAYADTDSLHLLTDTHPNDLDIDSQRLGAWKHEKDFDSAIFVRAKCYSEHTGICHCDLEESSDHDRGCGYETHVAGLPAAVAKDVRFDDFYDGHVFPGKLLPKRVPGGIVLLDVGFTLNTN